MSVRTSPWPAGMPCWLDLQAPDVAAAATFYSKVLGWQVQDPSPGEARNQFGGHVIGKMRGAAAGGIGPRQGDAPVAWTLYFASDDADATAAAISEHGGTVVLPPDDVGDLGRLLIAMDPTGAAFGLWQAGSHIGAGLVNEPGGLTWNDLRSTDPDAARAFYSAVFGFSYEALEMAGPDYTTFHRPKERAPLGGMGGLMGAPSSRWLVYLGVADADAAVAAARQAGGTVSAEPFGTPYGRMAGLADPAGADFWVVETDGSRQPDRSG